MVGESIFETIHAPGVEQSELEEVLLNHFKTSMAKNPEVILYPGQETDFAVELRYEEGVLVDVVAGPALTHTEVNLVRQRIEADLLAPTETQVGRVVLFASVPVTGHFRYQDLFQWVPVPPEAPRPPFTMGEHPFLLEFQFRGSLNGSIRHLRRAILERELELLAAGLLEFTVRGLGRQSRYHWVLLQDDLKEPWTSGYRPETYTWPALVLEGGQFTDTTAVPRMSEIAPEEYYTRGGIGPDRALEIPATLTGLLNRFFTLPAIERERFLRACFWFQHGHTVWTLSRSASFTAMVSAVEALMPPVKGAPVCQKCKRPMGTGPTKLFTGFVDEFAPGSTVESRRRFYAVRSALSHGGTLLHSDRRTWSPHMTGAKLEEWEDIGGIWRLVRIVLVNWLARHPATRAE